MLAQHLTVVASEPLPGTQAARWVSLQLAGVTLFAQIVYDTDSQGNRTEEQAVENFAHVLAGRLQAVLDPC